MAKSRNWSNTSAPCRLEWPSSRWLAACLGLLGLGAALAVIASEMPFPASLPLAFAALVQGLGLARRELRRCVHCLIIGPGEGVPTLDGEPMTDLELQWRGPLAFLCWRDAAGHRRHLTGWPDILDAGARRELRLAMAARTPAPRAQSMAT
ncbi:hypothetical protein ACFQZQ_03395 [Lysobacter koreensis]|uniref:DUF2244 domain-containing protein n=1 Tax=Lysobacter koreensis TaxID=266122 RepID=A0ABW2YIS6_9GAMM